MNSLAHDNARRDSSRPLSKSATLDHYKRELLASQYREAVYKRRIQQANLWLSGMGIRINDDPWSSVAIEMDGGPVEVRL